MTTVLNLATTHVCIGPLMELIDAKDVQDLSEPILLANLIKTVKTHYAQIQSKTERNLSRMNIYIKNLKREQIIENDSKNVLVLTIGDEKLKMVPEFVYLGHLIRYDGDKLPNLKRRIKKATQAVFKVCYSESEAKK